ncbi:MAG: HDIG domain-containing protein [Treponema sp.]|nr:HDIG domain-containing protein [Treponema sp.]
MKKKKIKKDSDKESNLKIFFQDAGNYIKVKYPYLLLAFLSFIALSLLTYFKLKTVPVITGFSIDEYRIGQISDRTIIADSDIAPDEEFPVEIVKGEEIISKGFAITEEKFEKLKKISARPNYIDYRSYANIELFLLLMIICWYMLYTFIPFGRQIEFKEALLEALCAIIVYAITCFCIKIQFFTNAYSVCMLIPAALFVILVAILYGNLSSVIYSFMMAFVVLAGTGWQLPSFIFVLSSCLSSALIVRKIDNRMNIIIAGLLIGLLNLVFMLLIMVIFNEPFKDMVKLLLGLFFNGVLTGMLTLGLLTPLERVLNTASIFRLMDLATMDTPLFRKMQINANGTFNHTQSVALLAESACRDIKANALLAKVGAYYHDIGKIEQSEYFTENNFDNVNHHQDLTSTMSTSIIKSHVKKGVEKAHELRLPTAVINIIAEHHGNDVIEYFYKKGVAIDDSLSREDFAYPGNPPTTKESAVVMLADTVEAACHTLDNPTVPRLEKFITMLINGKMDRHQLDNCDLTFSDLTKIKAAFVQQLGGYYHNRIKYPNQKDPDAEDKKEDISKENQPSSESKNKSEGVNK